MSEYTLEGMEGGLEDPGSLWPELPELEEESAAYGWVWSAMTPAERRAKMRELAEWVEWLRATFELHNQIPQCWYRHPPVREHLTALYAGWVRTYCQPAPGRTWPRRSGCRPCTVSCRVCRWPAAPTAPTTRRRRARLRARKPRRSSRTI